MSETKTYLVIDKLEQVAPVLESHPWSLYARLLDRQDAPIQDASAVQSRDGVLWVNAGEWHPRDGYLNEEWVQPQFIYLVHQCDGCSYPPNMCCLQPSSFVTRYPEEWDANVDDAIMSSDAYLEAEAALGAWPIGVEAKRIEA